MIKGAVLEWPWVEANDSGQQKHENRPSNDARTNSHEPMLYAHKHRRPIHPAELALVIYQTRQIRCCAIFVQLW